MCKHVIADGAAELVSTFVMMPTTAAMPLAREYLQLSQLVLRTGFDQRRHPHRMARKKDDTRAAGKPPAAPKVRCPSNSCLVSQEMVFYAQQAVYHACIACPRSVQWPFAAALHPTDTILPCGVQGGNKQGKKSGKGPCPPPDAKEVFFTALYKEAESEVPEDDTGDDFTADGEDEDDEDDDDDAEDEYLSEITKNEVRGSPRGST